MQRKITDWGGNLVAFAIVILLNVLSNALPINGQNSRPGPALTASVWVTVMTGPPA